MPPKQRQIRMAQTGQLAAMQALEQRTDDELLREQKFKAAAQAILGARAAERYDAPRRSPAGSGRARPQERMQLRRMADASLALAERRPDDLKQAVERLGQAPPTGRQLFLLRIMGLLAPAPGASLAVRARGILIMLAVIVVLVLLGWGIVELIALPFGGVGTAGGLLLGILAIALVLGILALVGRRRQQRAKARAAAG